MDISPFQRARIILDSIALLQIEGYGRLKIYCYIKEGLGAWRHNIFAGDKFPTHLPDLPKPVAHGSLPDWPVVGGNDAESVARNLLRKFPDLFVNAKGMDDIYTNWFQSTLRAHPGSVIVMERQDIARLLPGHVRVPTPYEPLSEPEYED